MNEQARPACSHGDWAACLSLYRSFCGGWGGCGGGLFAGEERYVKDIIFYQILEAWPCLTRSYEVIGF